MKKILILIPILIVSLFSDAYAQETSIEPIILEQLTPSGDVNVKIEWPEVYPDDIYIFKVSFHDPQTDELLQTDTRVDYSVIVSQNDHTIEHYFEEQTLAGTEEYEVLFPEDGEGLAEVSVVVHFIRTDEQVLKLDEEVTFSVNVVPEFGVAALIFAAAFVPILLLSKSKLRI